MVGLISETVVWSDRVERRCKRGAPSQAGPIPNTLFDLVESTGGKQGMQLTVRMGMNGKTSARVEAIDNGMGIADEDLTRIFAHGYATKKEGHGFGLHSSARLGASGGFLRVVLSRTSARSGAPFQLVVPTTEVVARVRS